MRRNLQTPCAADPHPVDSVEQTTDQSASIDPDLGYECGAVIVECSNIRTAPRLEPANRIASIQPHTQPNSIVLLSPDRRAAARDVLEQPQARSQPSIERVAF